VTRILQKRLFDEIRGRLGAAYGANAGLGSIVPDRYPITLSSAVAHESAAAALAALDEVYAKFLAEGVNESEVAPMRVRLRSEALSAQIRAGAMAGALLSAMLNDLAADHVQRSLERIDNVSAEAINADIRTKLVGRPLNAIVVAPSATPFKADCVVKAAAEVLSACR
jgi:predicted Zn-dependent peptidase